MTEDKSISVPDSQGTDSPDKPVSLQTGTAPTPISPPTAQQPKNLASAVTDEESLGMADLLRNEEMENDDVAYQKGNILTGEVIQTGHEFVFVNLGSKIDGKISASEFDSKPKIGDKVKAAVISINRENGDLLLSLHAAKKYEVYEKIQEALKTEEASIEGKVLEHKGEFFKVDIGIPVDVKEKEFVNRIDDFKHVIGNTFRFKISKFIEKKDLVFLSRRAYLYEVREKQRKNLLENLQIGKKVKGIVKNIMPYGVFVDLGGIDGFIHVSDLSWGRNPDVNSIVKQGDEIEVLILKVEERKPDETAGTTVQGTDSQPPAAAGKDKEKKKYRETIKISLGYKQLKSDPWKDISERYQIGMNVHGKVVNVLDFGAFIELEEGIDAFTRREDISWSRNLTTPKKLLKRGQIVEGRIISLSPPDKKIAISLKELLPNPWDDIKKKYYIGQKISGKIVKVIEHGAFVELDDNVDGFINLDNISWTERVKRASDHFKSGQLVEAIIKDINPADQRINLSIKDFTADPMVIFKEKNPKDSIITGKITGITKFGLFMDLGSGLEGLVHKKDIPKEKAEKLEQNFKKGEEISAVVANVDLVQRRVALSLRNYQEAVERKEMEKFMTDDEDTNTEKLGTFWNLKTPGGDKKL